MLKILSIIIFFISLNTYSSDNFEIKYFPSKNIKSKKNRYIVEVPNNKKSYSKSYLNSVSKTGSLNLVSGFKTKVFSGFHVVEATEENIAALIEKKLIQSATLDITYDLQDLSKESNYPRYKPFIPNDTFMDQQWGMYQSWFTSLWSKKQTSDVLIFVADTWVDKYHPDLNTDQIEDVVSFLPEGINETLKHYHGTHVAGIISAKSNNNYGVAGALWNAKIVPLEVCYSLGCPLSAIADAIIYSADSFPEFGGPRVINLSLGAAAYSSLLKRAVEYAQSKDVSIVAASGNSNVNAINFYPASYPGVISVGASQKKIMWEKIGFPQHLTPVELAPYSNYGTDSLTILAPGSRILSTIPTDYLNLTSEQLDWLQLGLYDNDAFSFLSGTSMAAPLVTASVAVIRDEFPHLTYLDVKSILEKTHSRLNVESGNVYSSGDYSYLNAESLLLEARNFVSQGQANNSIQEKVEIDFSSSYVSVYGGKTHLEGVVSACDSPDQKVRIRWFVFDILNYYSPGSFSYSIRSCGESFTVDIPIGLPEEVGYFTLTPFIMIIVDDFDSSKIVRGLNPIIHSDGNDFIDLRNLPKRYD